MVLEKAAAMAAAAPAVGAITTTRIAALPVACGAATPLTVALAAVPAAPVESVPGCCRASTVALLEFPASAWIAAIAATTPAAAELNPETVKGM